MIQPLNIPSIYLAHYIHEYMVSGYCHCYFSIRKNKKSLQLWCDSKV